MSISGLTPCQAGGEVALKAIDQAVRNRRAEAGAVAAQTPLPSGENRPVAGAVVGGTINTTA